MDQNKKSLKAQLKQDKKAKDWDQMLVTAQRAVSAFPKESFFWKALAFAQSHYVDEKLKSDLVHDLEKKEAHGDLLQIYQRLLSIFPDSKKIQKRVEKAEAAQSAKRAELEASSVQSALQTIARLESENNFEAALQASYELLLRLPGHKESLKINRRLLKKRNRLIEQELPKVFKQSLHLLQQEWKADKDAVLVL